MAASAKWRAAVAGWLRNRSAIQPAELGVDPLLGRLRGVIPGDRVGSKGIASVEQLAGDDAPLDPPSVTVGQEVGVAAHVSEDLDGFVQLVPSAQKLRLGEAIRRLIAQGRRHGIERLLGIIRLLTDRHARLARRT